MKKRDRRKRARRKERLVETIVKIQLEQAPIPGRRVLIYDQKRSIMVEQDVSPGLHTKMAGREKAYFHATLHGGSLDINEDAGMQNW